MQRKSLKLLEEFFSCPICLDILQEPTTTICGHNFCSNCIKKTNYECAVCRKILVEEGVSINYQIKNILESTKNLNDEEFEKKYFGRQQNFRNTFFFY